MEAAQRFRREARASAAFAHPNVVTVHDFGVEAGARGFLVMEFLEGNTLRDEIAKLKRIGTSRIIEIFSGVCAAVEAAHARQLIHRDLKPENIFLAKVSGEKQEVVKILDFGIAKFIDEADDSNAPTVATHTGVLIGTLPYMSPEQFLGEAPHPLWDLWALTVVAYECLTGALPFSGDSPVTRRNEVVSGNFTPLEKYVKSPRPAWMHFFARSFHRNNAKRPQSASEFFQELTRALGSS
jgi:serine/threonine-protein kinase